MSDNFRKQVRDAFVQILINAGTAAGDQVTAKRVRAHDPKNLPALQVVTGASDVEVFAMGSPSKLKHDLEISVICKAVGDDAEDDVDALAVEVHAALATNEPAFLLALDLTGTDISIEQATDKTFAAHILEYSVSYLTRGDDLTAIQ